MMKMLIKICLLLVTVLLAVMIWLLFQQPSETIINTHSGLAGGSKTIPATPHSFSPIPPLPPVNTDDMRDERKDRLKRYNAALQSELNGRNSLVESIAIAKRHQDEVFGVQVAAEVFSAQRKQFDIVLYIQALAEKSILEGRSKEQLLDELLAYLDSKELNDMEQYQYAQKLYSRLGLELDSVVKTALARRILSDGTLSTVLTREAQISVQQQQKEFYRIAFQSLLADLQQARKTTYHELTEEQWQLQKSEAISQFKREFFQ